MSGTPQINFDALYDGAPPTRLAQARAIDFAALYGEASASTPAPAKDGTIMSTPQTPPAPTTPDPTSAAGKATGIATKVATVASVASEAIDPGITQAPPVSNLESSIEGIEELAGSVLKFTPAGGFSGLTVPAEVVTHLVFAFISLFKHHVKTQSAAAQPAASVPQKG